MSSLTHTNSPIHPYHFTDTDSPIPTHMHTHAHTLTARPGSVCTIPFHPYRFAHTHLPPLSPPPGQTRLRLHDAQANGGRLSPAQVTLEPSFSPGRTPLGDPRALLSPRPHTSSPSFYVATSGFCLVQPHLSLILPPSPSSPFPSPLPPLSSPSPLPPLSFSLLPLYTLSLPLGLSLTHTPPLHLPAARY